MLAAIRICPLTATRLALSLSQSVSGSRYRRRGSLTDYGCELMQPGAGPGKRGSMLGTIGALAIASSICSRSSMPGSPATQNWPPSYRRADDAARTSHDKCDSGTDSPPLIENLCGPPI